MEQQICETSSSSCLHSSGEIGSEWVLSQFDGWRLLAVTFGEKISCSRSGSKPRLWETTLPLRGSTKMTGQTGPVFPFTVLSTLQEFSCHHLSLIMTPLNTQCIPCLHSLSTFLTCCLCHKQTTVHSAGLHTQCVPFRWGVLKETPIISHCVCRQLGTNFCSPICFVTFTQKKIDHSTNYLSKLPFINGSFFHFETP